MHYPFHLRRGLYLGLRAGALRGGCACPGRRHRLHRRVIESLYPGFPDCEGHNAKELYHAGFPDCEGHMQMELYHAGFPDCEGHITMELYHAGFLDCEGRFTMELYHAGTSSSSSSSPGCACVARVVAQRCLRPRGVGSARRGVAPPPPGGGLWHFAKV